MRNAQVNIMSAADNVTQTGSAFDVGQAVSASFVPSFGDATAAGTVKIQCSNDGSNARYTDTFVPTNWADIPNATSTVVAGVGPAIVIPNMCFSYIRAVYTRTSGGSTTININMNVLSI